MLSRIHIICLRQKYSNTDDIPLRRTGELAYYARSWKVNQSAARGWDEKDKKKKKQLRGCNALDDRRLNSDAWSRN